LSPIHEGPFDGENTTLKVPESVTPGIPFRATLTVANHTNIRILESRLQLTLPEGLQLWDETITVGGRRLTVKASGSVLSQPLAPFQAEQSRKITVELVADERLAGSRAALRVALVTPTDTSEMTGAFAVENAGVEFSPTQCVLDVSPASLNVKLGEDRELTAVLHNEGTATARNVRIDWRLKDLRGPVAPVEVGDIAPGGVHIARTRVTVTGARPSIDAAILWDGGRYVFTPVAFEYDAPSTNDLVQSTDVLFDSEGKRVPGALERRSDVRSDVPVEGRSALTEQLRAALSSLRSLVPLRHRFQPLRALLLEEPIIGKTIRAHYELYHDGGADGGNADVNVAFAWGPSLAYAGRVEINGVPMSVPEFEYRGAIGFADVKPGTVIAITVDLLADGPTRDGSTTTFKATATWDGESISAGVMPFAVQPKAEKYLDRTALPFVVVMPTATESNVTTGTSGVVEPLSVVKPSSNGSAAGFVAQPPSDGIDAVPESLNEGARARAIGLMSNLSEGGELTLGAVIGIMLGLAPNKLASDLEVSYKPALSRFRRCVNAALKRTDNGEPLRMRPEEIESIRTEAAAFTLALGDDALQSIVSEAPSFAATLGAFGAVLGKQYPSDHALAEAGRELGAALATIARNCDSYEDAEMSAEMLSPADEATIAAIDAYRDALTEALAAA
jgi:hypothetical protein